MTRKPEINARESDPHGSRQLVWLNALLASTATVLGCAFFVGHDSLRRYLALRFDITTSLLSVYTYDEILMDGIDTILRFLMPRLAGGVIFAYILHQFKPALPRRILATALGVIFAVIATATPMPALSPFVGALFRPYPLQALSVLFTAAAIVSTEALAGNLLFPLQAWVRHSLLIGLWFYVLWLFPQVMPSEIRCVPVAALRVKDGRHLSYSLISLRAEYVVLGDSVQRRIVFFPIREVAELTISGCE